MKHIIYNNNKLSKLALGTVQFGINYGIANKTGQPSLTSVESITNYVLDNGINCFDTAASYGTSEKVLGLTLEKTVNKPNIISKLTSEMFLESYIEHVQNSLDNLKIDKLFALLLHDGKLLSRWNETFNQYILDLKLKNKITYFGVSIYSSNEFELALNNKEIDIIQIPYNLLDQRAFQLDWFTEAKKKNKLLFIRSVFLQGLLLMDLDDIPSHLYKVKKSLQTIQSICDKHNISKSQLALNFVDTTAHNSIILFGCENIDQAQKNLTTFKNLSPLNYSILKELTTLFKDIDEKIYNPSLWDQS